MQKNNVAMVAAALVFGSNGIYVGAGNAPASVVVFAPQSRTQKDDYPSVPITVPTAWAVKTLMDKGFAVNCPTVPVFGLTVDFPILTLILFIFK